MDNIQEPAKDLLPKMVMDNLTLRYSPDLHNVDWSDIAERVLPSLSKYQKSTILHASGKYSISPIVLLSKVANDQNDISYELKVLNVEWFIESIVCFDLGFNFWGYWFLIIKRTTGC